jgi:hypothetical protein
MILATDDYDSVTDNLVQRMGELGYRDIHGGADVPAFLQAYPGSSQTVYLKEKSAKRGQGPHR